MPSFSRQNARWFLQPYDLCGVWRGVLLALHERNLRFALPEPFRMHILGQKTVVKEEEIVVAIGNTNRCSGRHSSISWDLNPSHVDR